MSDDDGVVDIKCVRNVISHIVMTLKIELKTEQKNLNNKQIYFDC